MKSWDPECWALKMTFWQGSNLALVNKFAWATYQAHWNNCFDSVIVLLQFNVCQFTLNCIQIQGHAMHSYVYCFFWSIFGNMVLGCSVCLYWKKGSYWSKQLHIVPLIMWLKIIIMWCSALNITLNRAIMFISKVGHVCQVPFIVYFKMW